MHPPEGLSIDSNLVCKINAPCMVSNRHRLSEKRFDEAVKDLGYVRSKADNSVHVLNTTENNSYVTFCR